MEPAGHAKVRTIRVRDIHVTKAKICVSTTIALFSAEDLGYCWKGHIERESSILFRIQLGKR